MLEQHLAVNLFGPYGVTQAFLPLLTRSRGAIVNNVSTMALAPLPLTPAYSISKAAAFSLTQSLRALLAGRGVRVHAVLTGPTDTDMTRGFDIPKASPESVARAIFDGRGERGGGHLPRSRVSVHRRSWRSGAVKALEREYAAFVATTRRGINRLMRRQAQASRRSSRSAGRDRAASRAGRTASRLAAARAAAASRTSGTACTTSTGTTPKLVANSRHATLPAAMPSGTPAATPTRTTAVACQITTAAT